MRAGGGGRDACPASAFFSSSWANGVEEAIEDACPTSVPFPFFWANGVEEVRQTDSSALPRPWSIPAGGGGGCRGSLSSGIGNACDFLPRPAAAKVPQFCSRKRSVLHVPMQRIAFAIAARCVCRCSALRFSFHRGTVRRAAYSVPVPRLQHHSSVCTVMNWAPGFGRAWHGAKDFQQTYRKIPQKAVLWQKKRAGWLDLSQNLDKFTMIIAKKQKHEGKTFPRCAAQRSVSQATGHIPQTTKASGLEEVQQGREIPYE